MLEGAVERGTGKVLLKVGKPVAGKTGTTNEERDSWFIGFTPDLTVGVYVGYDTPVPVMRPPSAPASPALTGTTVPPITSGSVEGSSPGLNASRMTFASP